MTRPTLSLHFRENLGRLPIRNRRFLIRHGNAHVPEERDQRIGLDVQVVR